MKKFSIVMLVLLMLLTLTACGKKITPNEPYDMSDGIVLGEYKEMNFTVCTYNIKGGAATFESVSKIKDNIQSVGADIAGLQEVDHLSNRTGKQDFLSIFKNSSYLNNVAYFPLHLQGFGDSYGIAQVSKNNFDRKHSFKLPYPYEYEKSDVEKRIIMRTLITINGVQIAFYNTHLSYEEVKLDNGISLREAQFDYILQLLKSDPCPYKIVTGDYNVLGFYEFSKLLDNGYSIVNKQNKIYDSYRGDDCNFKAIDNIIYSNNLELISSGMKEDDCSDHNMLYAKFKTIK